MAAVSAASAMNVAAYTIQPMLIPVSYTHLGVEIYVSNPESGADVMTGTTENAPSASVSL